MNILLLASHAVAEYDDLRMFTDLGYDCFAPGGYEVPGQEGEGIRPPLPDAPSHPDLVARLHEVRSERGEPGPAIDWGKAALHDDIIDWADTIIVHHFPVPWIGVQWERIKRKRVIWRTCGQSNPELEMFMAQFVKEGLQVVRYSPAEQRHFEKVGCFAGEDALIRFGKYPDDYGPQHAQGYPLGRTAVGNLTQDMVARGDACGYGFWLAATEGLDTEPAGKGSEAMPGGLGQLSYPAMLQYLSQIRTYLYTGTRPASYTLGMLEACLSGIPVVCIGKGAWGGSWGGEDLYDFRGAWSGGHRLDDPAYVRERLRDYLNDYELAREHGERVRKVVAEEFGIETIGRQWQEFLS